MTLTNNKLFLPLAALLGVSALYVGSVAVIGGRVAEQVDQYQSMLLARDDVSVLKFDYERRFFGGQLVYELAWRPSQASGVAAQILEPLGFYDEKINLAGQFDIRHGPWLGGINTGLARLDLAVPLPDQMRDFLPQYPGKLPVLSLQSTLGFTGQIATGLSVQDYDGRIVEGSETLDLQIDDVAVTLVTNRDLTQVQLEMRAQQLELGAAEMGTFRMAGLRALSEFWLDSGIWMANTDVDLGELGLAVLQQDMRFVMNDYSINSRSEVLNDTVDNTASFAIEEVIFNDQVIGGIAMESSMRGIHVDSYKALQQLWADTSATDMSADPQRLTDALSKLVTDKISFNVERLALSLPSDDDILATLSVNYDGSEQVDGGAIDDVINAITVESSLQASLSAINRAIDNTIPADQQASVRTMLDEFYELPYVTVSNDSVSSTLNVQGGEILINGQALADATEFLASVGLAEISPASPNPADLKQLDPAPEVAKTVDPAPAAVKSKGAATCPDFNLAGRDLFYSSDDLYSPQTFEVVAGGPVDLGLCSELPGQGYVMDAPDFKLNFSGNSAARELEIRVDSNCDSILLLNDTSGTWHHDDDSNGSLDAKIRLPKAVNGVYDIWVGTLTTDTCDATLTLETF